MEWNYPESFDLRGVEFKAMPSGAHNVQHDTMIFEIRNHFGIAAYIMKQVRSGPLETESLVLPKPRFIICKPARGQLSSWIYRRTTELGVHTTIFAKVDVAAERGARMKSVGVVCSHYLPLHQHQERLVS